MWGLVRLGKAFSVVAYDSEPGCGDAEEAARKSDKLKMFIREYFTEVERSVPDTMPAAETCQHQVGEITVRQYFKTQNLVHLDLLCLRWVFGLFGNVCPIFQ